MNPDSRKDQEGAELLRAGVTGGFLQKQYTLLTTQLFLYHHHPQKKKYLFITCVYICLKVSMHVKVRKGRGQGRHPVSSSIPADYSFNIKALPEHETFVSARPEAGKSQQLSSFLHPDSGSWGDRHFQGCLTCYMSAGI